MDHCESDPSFRKTLVVPNALSQRHYAMDLIYHAVVHELSRDILD